MLVKNTLSTGREGFYDITAEVRQAVRDSGVTEGCCRVHCPHTTAGITVNENADPDVVRDMLIGLRAAYPDRPAFRHAEGNSAAHLRASAMGTGASLIIADGQLLLGRWQGIYFCEFDGPRTRSYYIQIV